MRSDELVSRHKSINKEISNRDYVRKFRSEKCKDQHSNGLSEIVSTSSKKMWEENRDGIIHEMKKAQSRNEVKVVKSKRSKEMWERPESELHRDKVNISKRTDSSRSKVSKSSKRVWRVKRDYIIDRMVDAQKNEEVKNIKSINSKKMWENDSSRKKHSDLMKKLWTSAEYRDMIRKSTGACFFTLKNGETIYLRSSWELRVCVLLEKQGIGFEYESLSFRYMFEGYERVYIPDFYIRDKNLVIEVKPLFRIDDRVIAKKHSVLDSGYDFMFITENELKDTDILVKNLLT